MSYPLYVLDPRNAIKEISWTCPLAIEAISSIGRMYSQHSAFTIHDESSLPLDMLFKGSDDILSFIEIEPSQTQKLLKQLHRAGIHHESIYRDLDSLCKKIKDEML